MTVVSFRVYGTPRPQGSKRHVGHGVMIESGGVALRTWREDVKQAALAVRPELDEPIDGPVELRVAFFVKRPASHWTASKRDGSRLRPAAPSRPYRRPDIDKLLRSTCDAISAAGLWADDSRVVELVASKSYCARTVEEGAAITIEALT